MQTDWTTYRITLLLYLGVLLLPFSFYYTYSLFDEMRSDTTIMEKLAITGGEILVVNNIEDIEARERKINGIDKSLILIRPWIEEHNEDKFYVGGRSFLSDYNTLVRYWNEIKAEADISLSNEKFSTECWEVARRLSFTAEKMLYLKQTKIYNLFYINFIVAMIFLFLLIFIVRAYIYRQLEKHTIYDLKTKLFNKNYFLSSLNTLCSRSVRHDHPLSLLLIELDDCGRDNKTYDDKSKKHILEMFGGIIISLTRSSDISARYEDKIFTILLPDTDMKNALAFEKRIYEILVKHDFMVTPKLKFNIVTTEYDTEETDKLFIERTLKMLQ